MVWSKRIRGVPTHKVYDQTHSFMSRRNSPRNCRVQPTISWWVLIKFSRRPPSHRSIVSLSSMLAAASFPPSRALPPFPLLHRERASVQALRLDAGQHHASTLSWRSCGHGKLCAAVTAAGRLALGGRQAAHTGEAMVSK